VLSRMHNEAVSAAKIKRKTRSYVGYIDNVFTQLELINLTSNWLFLFLRVYGIFMPDRRNFDLDRAAVHTDFSAFDKIATVQALSTCVQSFSIVTSCFLFFKYLTLMPKISVWYMTGTTLSRAGADLKGCLVMVILFLVSWAIIFEQVFGTDTQEFNGLWNSFVTSFAMLAGDSKVITIMARHAAGSHVLGISLFVVFYINFTILLVPFFLSIVRDSYAVRDDQLRFYRAKKRAEKDRKYHEKQEAAKRKRGGFH